MARTTDHTNELALLRMDYAAAVEERDNLRADLKRLSAENTKVDSALKKSELERFKKNLDNFAKTSPEDALYHRFQGILESQIVTLQCCGVITSQGAVKLHEQMATVIRARRA